MTKPLCILYRNHRGEVSTRRITPINPWYGLSPWHTGEQWFLRAIDEDKPEAGPRDFAMGDITYTRSGQPCHSIETWEGSDAFPRTSDYPADELKTPVEGQQGGEV